MSLTPKRFCQECGKRLPHHSLVCSRRAVKQHETADQTESSTRELSPPPSGVRAGEYTLDAYGHPNGVRGKLTGPAVTLTWYGPYRRGMRTTLTAKECRAYIAALALECERAEGGAITEKIKGQP